MMPPSFSQATDAISGGASAIVYPPSISSSSSVSAESLAQCSTWSVHSFTRAPRGKQTVRAALADASRTGLSGGVSRAHVRLTLDRALSRIESLGQLPDPLGECEPIEVATTKLARALVRDVANWAEAMSLGLQVPDVSADLDGRIYLSWGTRRQGIVCAIVSGREDRVVIVETRVGGVPRRTEHRAQAAALGVRRALASMFGSTSAAGECVSFVPTG